MRRKVADKDPSTGARIMRTVDLGKATRIESPYIFTPGGEVCLYRTRAGRWIKADVIVDVYSSEQVYEFISDRKARRWMVSGDVAPATFAEYFGKAGKS